MATAPLDSMVRVYSPTGEASDVYPVDVRELCEHCGYTIDPPKAKEAQVEVKSTTVLPKKG